jgi:hypothetical protein
MNYKLKTFIGVTFETIAKEAKEKYIELNQIVEFDFNGILCLVSHTTNLEWLWRDYMNAHKMDWASVGFDCVENYDVVTQVAILEKTEFLNAKYQKESELQKQKEDAERLTFQEKTKGIEIEIIDLKEWNDWKAKNTDGYGACIFEYAESWAKLMQAEAEAKGYSSIDFVVLSGIAEETSYELGFLGITGFMYGASVSILSKCWKYGEMLRKWHNKEYNHDGDGVVNPAIISVA